MRMSEVELISRFNEAIEKNYICPFYQMQINHSTKRMVGAEALMRWIDPIYGPQYPSDFIPVFEKNGLINQADIHVFECICKFLKNCLSKNINVVPISFNLSRYDLLIDDLVDRLEEIRKKYDIPVKYLRAEITESAAINGMDLIKKSIANFHKYGYIVEMDDFGSGYSSLNILKDLEFDVIKLDLRFFSECNTGRKGIIISSVVNMSKWLNTPIIAEGVEKTNQADYLRSIGCNYIQGYLYSKPIEEKKFEEMISSITHESASSNEIKGLYEFDTKKLWEPNSDGTYMFNNLMPAAAIFSYYNHNIEILKVNKKYIDELGMNLTEYDIINTNPKDKYKDNSFITYENTLLKAINSKKEEKCTVWCDFYSKCCGEDKICIESRIQMIGTNGNEFLFLETIHNVTQQIKEYEALSLSEKRFRYASEQINIYAWEYDISTKTMRPCFRCMRDLGLPAIIENYPEPVIENGIFPQDYADMYRDWHKQIEHGIKELEAIIPLTTNRIPFRVRYTTEFDENGRPLKAYGSAELIVYDK
ncbi:MAG: EAL domain-containing protein [Anaeroplasma sp.]